MNTTENPDLTPQQYKDALKTQLKALRRVRKIYRKEVLTGSLLYHTTLRTINEQIREVFDELIDLERDYPELNKPFKQRFIEKLEELGKAAASATQQH